MTLIGWNKHFDKNLSYQSYVIHHKSHTEWRGIKLSIARWEVGDCPPKLWHGVLAVTWRKARGSTEINGGLDPAAAV